MPTDEERYRQHLRDIGAEDDPELRRAWEEEDARNRQRREAPGGRGWQDQFGRARDEWERATRRTGEWDRWDAAERERQFAQHAQRLGYGSAQDLQDYLSGRPPGQEKNTYDDLMGRIADARAAREGGLYQVKPGDTLSQIAQRFGLDVEDLLKWNPRPDRNLLRVGEVITLPAYRAAKTPPPQPRSIPQGGLLGRPPEGAPAGHWQDEAIPMPPVGSAEWLRWAAGPKTRRVWKEDEPTLAKGNLDWLRRRLMPEAAPAAPQFGEELAPIGEPGAAEDDAARQLERMFTGQIAETPQTGLLEGLTAAGEAAYLPSQALAYLGSRLTGGPEEWSPESTEWVNILRRLGLPEGEGRPMTPEEREMGALQLGAVSPDVIPETAPPSLRDMLAAFLQYGPGDPLNYPLAAFTAPGRLLTRGAAGLAERAAARGGRAAVEAVEALAPGARRLAMEEAGAIRFSLGNVWDDLPAASKEFLLRRDGQDAPVIFNKLNAQARMELANDIAESVGAKPLKVVGNQILPETEAPRAGLPEAQPLPGQAAMPSAVAKQPWEMTQDEFYTWGRERLLAKNPRALSGGDVAGKEASFNITARTTHARRVQEALADGKPVPPEVLADYPDLVRAAPTPPEVPIPEAARPIVPGESVATGLADMGSAMVQGMRGGFIDSVWERLQSGKRVLFGDRPGTLEYQIQTAYDQGLIRSPDDIASLYDSYGKGARPGTAPPSALAPTPPVEAMPEMRPVTDAVSTNVSGGQSFAIDAQEVPIAYYDRGWRRWGSRDLLPEQEQAYIDSLPKLPVSPMPRAAMPEPIERQLVIRRVAKGKEGAPWRVDDLGSGALVEGGFASRAEAQSAVSRIRISGLRAGRQDWQMTQGEYVRLSYPRAEGKGAFSSIEAQHEGIVRQALSEGKPVPPEVLADYPNLAAKAVAPPPTEAIDLTGRTGAILEPPPSQITPELAEEIAQARRGVPPVAGLPTEAIPDAYATSWNNMPLERKAAILKALGRDEGLARSPWETIAQTEREAIIEGVARRSEDAWKALDEGVFTEPPPNPPQAFAEAVGAPPNQPPAPFGGPPKKPPAGGLPPQRRLIWELKDVAEERKDLFNPSFWRNMAQAATSMPDVGGAIESILRFVKPSIVATDSLAQGFILRAKNLGFARTAPDLIMSQIRVQFPRGSTFALDDLGNIINVTARKPGLSLNYMDVLSAKNPGRLYNLTAEQVQEASLLKQVVKEIYDYMLREGVDIDELAFPIGKEYFPRIPTGINTFEDVQREMLNRVTSRPVGAPQTFQKARKFEEAVTGAEQGVSYLNDPWKTVELHLQQAYTAVANKRFLKYIEGLATPAGVTPKSLVTELRYPKAMAELIDQRLTEQGWKPLQATTAVSDVLRTQTAGMDVGQLLIQAQTLVGHPVVFAKTIRHTLASLIDPRYVEVFRAKYSDSFEFLVRNNLLPSRSMPYLESSALSTTYKIPVFGPIYKRAQIGFGSTFDAAAVYLTDALTPFAKAAHGERWEAELTTLIRNMIGMGTHIGMGANQQLLERTMGFATSYYRASIGLTLGIAKGGIHTREGIRALASMAAAWVAWQAAVNLSQGKDINVDPRRGDFNSAEIGGWNIGPGSIWNSLYKAIGRMVAYGVLEPTGIIEPLKDFKGRPIKRDALESVLGIARDWGRAHSGPLISAAWDVAAGKNYISDPLRTTDDWLRWGAGRLIPFAFQDFVRPGDTDLAGNLQVLPAQLLGLRVWPTSNAEKRNRLRSQYAQAEFGVEWLELNRNRQQALLKKYPDLQQFTEQAYAYWKRRADPEDAERADRLEAYYGGREPIYRKYEELLKAVPIGDDTGRRKLYNERQKELDALTRRIGLKDEDFGSGRPLYEQATVSEGKMDEPFNPNERVMFRSWADAYYGITEQFKDKNGVVDWDKAEAAQEQFKASKGDIWPRFEQYLDRNLNPKGMEERVFKDWIEAYYANPKELRQTWLQSNPVPSWKAIGAEIIRRWGYKFTWEPFDVDHPDKYSMDELNDVLANTPIPGLEEYQRRSNEDRVNALREFGERFYAPSGVVVGKDNVEEYLQATKWFDDNQVALDAWKDSKSLRDYRDSLYAQRNSLRFTRNQVIDNPDATTEDKQQAYEDEKVQREIINARLAQVRAQIPTYLPWPDVVAKYFSTSPSISDREEARGQQEPLAREASVSRGVSNDAIIAQIFETMPTTEKGATSEEISAWWDTNTPRLKELGYRQEPFKEEVGRIFDTMPDFGGKPTKEQRAILTKWWDDNKPRLIELGWTPKWESQVLELARAWWDERRQGGERTSDIEALAAHLEAIGMGDKESLQAYMVGPGADNLEKAFIWSEYYGLQAAGKKDEASQYFQAKKSRLKELGWETTPEQDEIDQIFEEYGRRKAENKKDAYNWLESMKPRLAELGYRFKDEEQPGAARQPGVTVSTAKQEWWDALTTEGTPEWRAEFEAVHNRPPNNIDYFRDYLWSLDFQRSKGRGPSRAEWERHYWQDVRQGRPRTRTPEFAPRQASGNGNRTLTNAQWRSVQDLLGRTGTNELIGSRFDSDRMSADARSTLLRYYRDHPYGARNFNDWLFMTRNAYRREELVPA